LYVLYLIVFSSLCSFQRYIIYWFWSHGTIGSIFGFETVGSSGTVAMGILEFSPFSFCFLIGALHLLIFLFLFYF
jgi:hypothetical protein